MLGQKRTRAQGSDCPYLALRRAYPGAMVKHDWSIIAVRTCITCDGTGKNPPAAPPGPGQQLYSQGPRPTECPTCAGNGEEQKRYTVAELAAELRSLAP